MKIHTLPSSGEAYDECQCSDEIKTGDLLIIESEKVVGVADTWPFAITVEAGNLDYFKDGTIAQEDLAKYSPFIIRACGQATLRGWPVRPNIEMAMAKIQQLSCSCCGAYHKGRQWSNRDDGYGLCNNCIDDCVTDPMDFLEAGANYGVPGYHYDIDGSHYRAKAGA